MLSNQLTTSDNFIKDAVIDHVLKDLDLELKDLTLFDHNCWSVFESLCRAKRNIIRGV